MIIDPLLHKQVAEHPYPLLFATISGAHLYGFPSPDSDYDLRLIELREWWDVDPELLDRAIAACRPG